MGTEFKPAQFPFGGFQSKRELAEYLVYGIPLDRSASFQSGCEEGPNRIRFANANIETVSPFSKIDLSNVLIHDLGDLEISDMDTPRILELLKENTKAFLDENLFPLAIGGEHTITAGIAQAIPRSTLIVIDAHLDLRKEYEGNQLSHACAIARAYETRNFDKVVFMGTRAVSKEELDFATSEEMTILWAHDLIMMNAPEFRKTISSTIDQESRVYLSIDMDGIDPAFAPGVGNPEANGLWPWHLFELIDSISEKLVGADITEYNPRQDPTLKTGVLAARIGQTILVEHYASRK